MKTPTSKGRFARHAFRAAVAVCGTLLLLVGWGCQTPPPSFSGQQAADAASAAATQPEQLVLHEGDLLRISFPGAPNLNTAQQIRRDGRIALPLVGEFKAAGLTCSDMEKELLKLYAKELVTKEVTVTVESSSYSIYMTGAVLRPGKLTYDRPVTALEAVMEAGVDYAKANLKAVAVIRNEQGRVEHYKLNLKRILQGQQGEPFKLKPADIVFVPERFTWF
jgi:polysaccharide biosynthesis/export protein